MGRHAVWTAVIAAAVLIAPGAALHAQPVPSDQLVHGLLSDDAFEQDTSRTYIHGAYPADLPPLLERKILSAIPDRTRRVAIRALRLYPVADQLDRWFTILKKTDSYAVKRWVIDVLSGCKDKAVVMPLVNELSCPDAGVRERAAIALKTAGDDRMYPMVLIMAKNQNPIYRVYAMEAMAHLYDQRFQTVPLEMLRDPNHTVRYYALRCAEMNNVPQSLSAIRNLAGGDPNFRVRAKAISILGNYRDSGSLYIFTRALGDREPSVRLAAATGLYHLNSRSAASALGGQLLHERDNAIKMMILSALARLGSAGSMHGLEKTLREADSPLIRALSAHVLGEARERHAVNALSAALADTDRRVRAEVCAALGAYREKRAQDELVRMSLSNDDRYVRTAALYALRRIADRASVNALHERAAAEKDPVIKSIIESMR